MSERDDITELTPLESLGLAAFGADVMASWPNCSVPDCEYKADIPVHDKCFAHARGEQPIPFEQYMAREGE